jgi:hypothetical protein
LLALIITMDCLLRETHLPLPFCIARYPGLHFSLYFTHWDRWCGTLHPKYDAALFTYFPQRHSSSSGSKGDTVQLIADGKQQQQQRQQQQQQKQQQQPPQQQKQQQAGC